VLIFSTYFYETYDYKFLLAFITFTVNTPFVSLSLNKVATFYNTQLKYIIAFIFCARTFFWKNALVDAMPFLKLTTNSNILLNEIFFPIISASLHQSG